MFNCQYLFGVFGLLLLPLYIQGQVPQGISYQAIARQNGLILDQQSVAFRFSIREGTPNGPVAYEETHTAFTNDFGLVNLTIGAGSPGQGLFESIQWGEHAHFLQVELDPGSGYQFLGTTELLSVPYALYAERAHMGLGDLLDVEAIPPQNGAVLKWNGSLWLPGPDIGESYTAGAGIALNGTIIENTGDLDPSNDLTLGSQAGGDLAGSFPNPSVRYLRGRLVANAAPGTGQVLKWNGAAWAPAPDELGPEFWQMGNGSNIYYTGGSIGVGLSNPLTALHVNGGDRVLFGNALSGAGAKLMWVPDKGAFRAGTVGSGIYDNYWNVNTDSVGTYSAAFGYRTRAKGESSLAAGNSSYAAGDFSMAIGGGSRALGKYAVALNRNTEALGQAALATGYLTDALGAYSFSTGRNTRAQAYAAVALGRYNLGGGNATQWISSNSEPLFEIGIGTSLIPANALTVYKGGLVRIHTQLGVGDQEYLLDQGSYTLASNAHLVPEINGSRSLGNSSRRWNSVYAQNGVINTSDRRDKQDIQDLAYGLEKLLELRPVSFAWTGDTLSGRKIGLIAQEVQALMPELVLDREWTWLEEEGHWRAQAAERLGIYYSDLIPVVIRSTQEQQAIIDQQEAELQALRQRVNKLEDVIARMAKSKSE